MKVPVLSPTEFRTEHFLSPQEPTFWNASNGIYHRFPAVVQSESRQWEIREHTGGKKRNNYSNTVLKSDFSVAVNINKHCITLLFVRLILVLQVVFFPTTRGFWGTEFKALTGSSQSSRFHLTYLILVQTNPKLTARDIFTPLLSFIFNKNWICYFIM